MLQKKDIFPYLASILTAVIFGLSFLFSKKALGIASPFKLISFRFLLAFSLLSLLRVLKVIRVDYKDKPIKELLIVSFTQPVVYFIFETYGIQYTSSSFAGLFIALIPIMVSLLGIYFLKEVPNKLQWVFIFLSVGGVVYIMISDYTGVTGGNIILGAIFLLIAITAASIYSIYSRKISSNFSSVEITYFMMGMGAVVFNIIAVSLDVINGSLGEFFSVLQYKDFVIPVLYLGVLSSAGAFFLQNYALSKLEASKSVVFANLSTVITIIAGVMILNERFYFYHMRGSIMILSGIIGTNYFSRTKAGSRESQHSLE